MEQYLENAISELRVRLSTTLLGSKAAEDPRYEISIIEKHLKLYREQKSNLFKIPGSFIRVEDTMEYLQGFRDGVVRSAK